MRVANTLAPLELSMDATPIQLCTMTRDISAAARFLNLLRKESRESRTVILVGACVFFVMPMLWSLIYLALDSYHEPGLPFSLLLTVTVGWLYAAILGAHTVCRDWGRPEEYFLLARPVSPRAAVGAKLLAGIIVLGCVLLGAAVADALTFFLPEGDVRFFLFNGGVPLGREPYAILVGLALTAMLVSYLIAFAAAVITRQMLTSTLITVLLLLIWCAAPLIVQPLAVLHPVIAISRLATDESNRWTTNLPCIAAVLICVGTAIAASFAAAGWERTFRLGHKTLAWAFALVILALFAGAMFEVGNSLTVLDTAMLPPQSAIPSWQFATSGDRVLAVSNGGDSRSLVTFRVDDRGRIQEYAEGTIYARGLWSIGYISQFDRNSAGEWSVNGLCQGGIPAPVFRMRLSWPDRSGPRITSLQVTVLDEPRQDHLREYRPNYELLRFATSDRHAYVEFDRTMSRRAMYVYDWIEQDGLGRMVSPVRVLEEGTPEFVAWLQSEDLKNLQWHGLRDRYRMEMEYGPRSAPRLDQVGLIDRELSRTALENELGGRHSQRIEWDQQRNLAVVNDTQGLRVYGPSPEGSQLLGENLASPLALAFRMGNVDLRLLSGQRAVEVGRSSLVLYDLADPARPRRVGFFNVQGQNPQVSEVNGRLVLWQVQGHQVTQLVLGTTGK
jgi:hypothetical protein